MTTADHEYMDTGSLTPDAVPSVPEDDTPVQEIAGSEGPDSDLPHGAEIEK